MGGCWGKHRNAGITFLYALGQQSKMWGYIISVVRFEKETHRSKLLASGQSLVAELGRGLHAMQAAHADEGGDKEQ
jgi:hypothetical protein